MYSPCPKMKGLGACLGYLFMSCRFRMRQWSMREREVDMKLPRVRLLMVECMFELNIVRVDLLMFEIGFRNCINLYNNVISFYHFGLATKQQMPHKPVCFCFNFIYSCNCSSVSSLRCTRDHEKDYNSGILFYWHKILQLLYLSCSNPINPTSGTRYWFVVKFFWHNM